MKIIFVFCFEANPSPGEPSMAISVLLVAAVRIANGAGLS
jgi:hypothetical protein